MRSVVLAVLFLTLFGCADKVKDATTETSAPETAKSLELKQPIDDTPNPPPTKTTVVGRYEGGFQFSPEFFDAMKKQAAKQKVSKDELDKNIKALKESKMVLDIGANGKYQLTSTAMGMSDTRKGEWAYDEQKNTLKIEPPKTDPDSKSQEFLVKDAGQTLESTGEYAGVAVSIVFKRSKE